MITGKSNVYPTLLGVVDMQKPKKYENAYQRLLEGVKLVLAFIFVAFLYGFPVVLVILLVIQFIQIKSPNVTPPVTETACRGEARDYVSTWDNKTYTYKCDEATGLWAFSDRFSDPSCNLIKGNISVGSNEKIYHTKGQAYYDDTRIDPEYGERAFCSEQEAINAGWRKSKI